MSDSPASLDAPTTADLLTRAREARRNAYAPYSHFSVGAALLAESGAVYTGCNVENAAYGLTMCAERVAIGKAVSEGERAFRAVAVVGPEDEIACAPCGSCRQVLYEFNPDLQVITPGGESGATTTTVRELLPGAFGPERLATSEVKR